MPKLAASKALVEDLVAASRILAEHEVLDAYGHVSARSDKRPEHFIMSRSRAPALVTAADLIEWGADGEPARREKRKGFIERYIHGEIYRARPEVMAVVHSHSPSIIPFGITDVPLRPIYHMSSFLGAGVPVFEIREAGGAATDMLIRDPALGAAVARKLGESAVVLMRGHGNVVVGGSVREVVFRAVYTEVNARLEADALRLGQGQVVFLNDEEAKNSTATNRGQITRAWDLWKAKALGANR